MNIPLHPEVTDALTPEQVEHLLAHMLRIPELFALARSHVAETLFNQGVEGGRWLVWRAALRAAGQYGPSVLFDNPAAARTVLEGEVKAAAGHGGVIPEVMNEVCQVCAEICDACRGECEKHESEHCQRCAEACRRCAEECRHMAGALA